MTKQQKQTELSRLINDCQIYNAFEALTYNLKQYQKQQMVHTNLYEIQLEFTAAYIKLGQLQNILNDLVEQSDRWESPE